MARKNDTRNERLKEIVEWAIGSLDADKEWIVKETVHKINRLFKGKSGWWCPGMKITRSHKCDASDMKDCKIADIYNPKICNRNCRIIWEG